MQPVGQLVEIGEARGHARNVAAAGQRQLGLIDRLAQGLVEDLDLLDLRLGERSGGFGLEKRPHDTGNWHNT